MFSKVAGWATDVDTLSSKKSRGCDLAMWVDDEFGDFGSTQSAW